MALMRPEPQREPQRPPWHFSPRAAGGVENSEVRRDSIFNIVSGFINFKIQLFSSTYMRYAAEDKGDEIGVIMSLLTFVNERHENYAQHTLDVFYPFPVG